MSVAGDNAMTMNPLMVAFHGDLTVFSLLDIIQLVHSSQKTGRLRLYSKMRKESGEIVFNQGKIAAVRTSHSSDETALQQLFQMELGSFEFQPSAVPFYARIQLGTPTLLMRCLQHMDEQRIMLAGQTA